MTSQTEAGFSQAYLEEIFNQYDMIKKSNAKNQRAFSSTPPGFSSCQPDVTRVSRDNDVWYADPSGEITRSDIRSCMISIRKWYSQRSMERLPPLITEHKCTIDCHKNSYKPTPIAIHKKPLVYGCELTGILHFCNPNVTCEWTHKGSKTSNRMCVFSVTRCVGEWTAPVDGNYLNYHTLKDAEDCGDRTSYGNYDYGEGSPHSEFGGNSHGGDRGEFYDSSGYTGGWDDDIEEGLDKRTGFNTNHLIGEYDSHKRIHTALFESLERQKNCNTYNPNRAKKRRKAKERSKRSESSSVYNVSQVKVNKDPTTIYVVESGIQGDSFYICTPTGDTLGPLLGGKEVPKTEFCSDEIDPVCAPEFDSFTLNSDRGGGGGDSLVKRHVTEAEKKKGNSKNVKIESPKRVRANTKLLTVDQMEKLDQEVLASEEYIQKFREMSISIRLPVSVSSPNKRRRGPMRGYKKRFSTKVETVKGEEIGVIGFNGRYKVSGLPAFSSTESMESFVEREKMEMGYSGRDKSISEDLENYNIYDILRDKVVEEINKEIPGYLSKKERYKLKKRREAGILDCEDVCDRSINTFKQPVSLPKERHRVHSRLSSSSPSLSCGTPSRTVNSPLSTPRRNRWGLSASSSPLSQKMVRKAMTPSPSPMRSPLIFGTSVGKHGSNTPSSSLMILAGSTPSGSMTPTSSRQIGAEHIKWAGGPKDVTTMRKWPVGKTLRDQTKIADIVGEKVHRIIIDLLVDRGPRRSIVEIKVLSMKDNFHKKARILFNGHASYKNKEGVKIGVPVNYHTLHALWRKLWPVVVEKKPPPFSVESQIAIKEKIVKCWMLLSRKEYAHKRNKKKASLFSFIVGALYTMAHGGYTTNNGTIVIEHDKWLEEHLPTVDDMDVLNKRKIGPKSNRGFSCKGNLVSKSSSVAALSPDAVKLFGQGTNRTYTRRSIGEGKMLLEFLLSKYEQIGPGTMEQLGQYLKGEEVIDKLIIKNPLTEM